MRLTAEDLDRRIADRFESNWREQEPREAASAVSEFQEGAKRPGSHRPLSSWARWLWKLVTR